MSVLDEYLVDPKVSLLCQQQVGNALEIVLLKRDDVLFGQAVARRWVSRMPTWNASI